MRTYGAVILEGRAGDIVPAAGEYALQVVAGKAVIEDSVGGATALTEPINSKPYNVLQTPTADVSMGSQLITNVADPVAGADASTWSRTLLTVRTAQVATTGTNITLSGGAPNTLDGIALAAATRVLVKDQTNQAENGIYIVGTLGTGANGTWSRVGDSNSPVDFQRQTVMIQRGTINKGNVYYTAQPGVLGTDPIIYDFISQGFVGILTAAVDNTLTAVAELNAPSLRATGKTGATAVPPILAGGTTSGAPTTGAHVVGEVVVSNTDGRFYVCTVAGTPGTWVTLTTDTISAASSILGGMEIIQTHGATGSTEQINLLSGGNYHIVTQDVACTYTFAGAVNGRACSFTIQFTATPVGATTWPTSVKWPDGTAPTLTGVSIVSFVSTDGGTTWYGFPGGKAFA